MADLDFDLTGARDAQGGSRLTLRGELDLGSAGELASALAQAPGPVLLDLYTERSEVAHTLQASLLPEALPDVPGWRFASDYRPGERGAEVGGDFYDVFTVEGGHMVHLGDVTGKGGPPRR